MQTHEIVPTELSCTKMPEFIIHELMSYCTGKKLELWVHFMVVIWAINETDDKNFVHGLCSATGMDDVYPRLHLIVFHFNGHNAVTTTE